MAHLGTAKLEVTFRADDQGWVWVDLGGEGQVIAVCWLEDEPSPAIAEGIAAILNACAAGTVSFAEGEHPEGHPAEVMLRTVFRRRPKPPAHRPVGWGF